MSSLELLAVVALLQDIPEKSIVRGQIGTIVEILSPSAVSVDFSDLEGRSYAIEPLHRDLLIHLHNRPLDQVA